MSNVYVSSLSASTSLMKYESLFRNFRGMWVFEIFFDKEIMIRTNEVENKLIRKIRKEIKKYNENTIH
jgi:hypothetical protein